jgi:hypothetical protein
MSLLHHTPSPTLELTVARPFLNREGATAAVDDAQHPSHHPAVLKLQEPLLLISVTASAKLLHYRAPIEGFEED